MRIEEASVEHLDEWLRLRAALWPDGSVERHRTEVVQMLAEPKAIAFIARSRTGEMVGFAEATLRHEYVNGCNTSPVLFLEGIYVCPEYRRQGVAQSFCHVISDWGRAAGCHEFASDALLENTQSHAFHAALGFEETRRVVYFRKSL
ncbi:MAG: GNAT family N-acetyltransferase [Rhizobium sp.]